MVKKVLFNNLLWEALGKGLNLISVFIVNFILANYLGPELFGSFSYVIAFSSGFLILSEFGLERIEIRETVKNEKIIESSLLIRLVASISSYSLLALCVSFLESDVDMQKMILIFAVSNFASIGYAFKNFFIGKFKNLYSSIALNFRDIFTLVSLLVLIYLKSSFSTILYYYLAAYFIEFIILVFIFTTKFKSYKLKMDFSKTKYLITKSFPLFIAGLLIFSYKKMDLIIINYFLNDYETGIYSSAQKIASALLTSTMVIIMVGGPILNKTIDTASYKKNRLLFFEIIILSSVLCSIIFFIFSENIIEMVFTKEYVKSIYPFKILIWKNVFESIFLATGYIIIIQDLQKKAYLRNLIAATISIISNLILISNYGIIAASYISLITYFFAGFVCNYFVKEYSFLNTITLEALKFSEIKKHLQKNG
ncbi:oligosaccharide flippase family protein [Tamlana crocina]|uniref:Oligosaccharide flippase family protein n=1 Tax=Tamlana crocina TaxID=393006 RepID=A0ABX1D6W5_9FLAO|nr:oligosaccharide flippase family protein [Tamlana crocina]NJX14040.1 oligosaccharide flippase family protein [Tamlana crocina]